ncbi:MAG: hypothetical protein GY884_10715, partial [Proteobacteria bacterium]|nr:hypothetical protein [Pseudomonadota bacterium]
VVYTLRDHIGKKPLLIGRSGSEVFVTSELKALVRVDWCRPLPLGLSRVDLRDGSVLVTGEHRPVDALGGLRELVEAAVVKRLPERSQPVGVFLSGGLDSSIIAALTARHRRDAVFYSLGEEGAPDQQHAAAVARALGLENVRRVPLPDTAALPRLIGRVVAATESFNPSIVSNGLATFVLAEAACQDGLKVVLTGDGADELFCGYHSFDANGPWRATRSRLISDMHMTELRRLDGCSMAHAIEARCPFLDRRVRAFSDRLGHGELYDGRMRKLPLREAFRGALPDAVLEREKTSFDVGSGVRGAVVRHLTSGGRSERAELESVWRGLFPGFPADPYFHSYPVFDEAIDRRGVAHRAD